MSYIAAAPGDDVPQGVNIHQDYNGDLHAHPELQDCLDRLHPNIDLSLYGNHC